MPVFKSRSAFAIIRNLTAFLNVEAGITRSTLEQHGWDPGISPQLPAQGQFAREDHSVRPQNLVWIFGYGRSGSTWLVRMLRDLKYTIWSDPRLGDLFGHLYYERAQDRQRASPQFVLGSTKETWLGPMRSFILESASLRFPRIRKGGGTLIIQEVHSTIGAPLLMEAVPESKMILLVRDPKDVVASHADASSPGGWVHEQTSKKRIASPATNQPDVYAHGVAKSYLRDIEKAKQAYDAHQGPKVLVRYEDLRADTLGTMRRLCSELRLAVDEGELARVVEKHSWENIPEEEKGEGKFHRKGTPGGWKEDLSRQQAEIVEEATAPILDEFYPSTERTIPFVFRPETHDRAVFRSVYLRNEYRLPESFQADDIIVDVGAHIGSFCYAALQRGSDNVYGFEPEKDNYAHAARNLRSFGDRVHLYNKAVWRSDRIGDRLSFAPSSDTANTAGGNVFLADTGEEVEMVAFDDVIREVTDNGNKRVRMLKLDCEGSEFPILFTSQSLHLIDEIRGEYHELGGEYDGASIPEVAKVSGYDRYTIAELTEALERVGFSVESARSGDTNLGHFFATRVA